MCRNVSPKDERGNAKDSWPCTTTNAGLFGKFKKTTPCVPGDDPSKDWDNMQRRKMLVKLWNRESFAGVAPTLPALPGGCNVAAEVEAAAGTFTNEYVEVVAKVGYDPDNLLPKFQAMVDRTTRRESLLVGGDYKLKAPAQTEFNTMEIVGVYRLVDKVHYKLYTARKEILRRMGVVPDNERLEGKILSTPRDDDEAGEDTLLAELTQLGLAFRTDWRIPQADLDADLNEVFLFHGTDPGTLPKIIAGGANERFGSLVGLFGAGNYFTELASKADQCAATAAAQLLPRNSVIAAPHLHSHARKVHDALQVPEVSVRVGQPRGREGHFPDVPEPRGARADLRRAERGPLRRAAGGPRLWPAPQGGGRRLQQESHRGGPTLPQSPRRAVEGVDEEEEGDDAGVGHRGGLRLRDLQHAVRRQQGGCKKDPERDNDGLEFVVYDGTQAYMQYILLYRRVVKRGAENKLEWNLPITVDGPEVIVVMDPLELSEVFVIGGKVKRKRVLAKYEDIANVGSLILPGGYHLGINAPNDFKEELAKRLDYFHRRQR